MRKPEKMPTKMKQKQKDDDDEGGPIETSKEKVTDKGAEPKPSAQKKPPIVPRLKQVNNED